MSQDATKKIITDWIKSRFDAKGNPVKKTTINFVRTKK